MDKVGELCHQHVRKMVDQNLVDGLMLQKRQFDTCEACQLEKQRGKPAQYMLGGGNTEHNQLVFANLLLPFQKLQLHDILCSTSYYRRVFEVYHGVSCEENKKPNEYAAQALHHLRRAAVY
uniref:GAG-pre-integrase domain-containing protein n=1 Tax=Hyaloperonospora arabidopsidis (strain Emoy2) TaxID=559515 RepID=M4BJ93_HYAAE